MKTQSHSSWFLAINGAVSSFKRRCLFFPYARIHFGSFSFSCECNDLFLCECFVSWLSHLAWSKRYSHKTEWVFVFVIICENSKTQINKYTTNLSHILKRGVWWRHTLGLRWSHRERIAFHIRFFFRFGIQTIKEIINEMRVSIA